MGETYVGNIGSPVRMKFGVVGGEWAGEWWMLECIACQRGHNLPYLIDMAGHESVDLWLCEGCIFVGVQA